MYNTRAKGQRIDRYCGPYERWAYSPELGLPFAFPPEEDISQGYFTAILEGTGSITDLHGKDVRLPPIWAPGTVEHSVLPFAFQGPTNHGPSDPVDSTLASALSSLEQPARYRVNFPIRPQSWVNNYDPSTAMAGWTPPAKRPKAIVAVIDDGIPFGNTAFLDATGATRVSHCWLQSATAEQSDSVPFGRSFTNGQIDGLRAQAGQDDALLYRLAGTGQLSIHDRGSNMRRHTSHGAHVMGLAAGNATHFGTDQINDEVQIIAVQLPNMISWDTSGIGKEMYLLSALHYVFDRARAIAAHYAGLPDMPEELPLFVNLSYGWTAGRHDGQSVLETAMQHMLEARQSLQSETAILMPAGNEFAGDLHAHITEDDMATGACRIGWQVQPDDQTCSYVEIWFPTGVDPSDYQIDLTPPHGQFSAIGELPMLPDPTLTDGDPRRFVELEIDGLNVGQMSADLHGGTRWRAMIALIPTRHMRGQDRCAPSGRWTIEVSRTSQTGPLPTGTAIQVWVQRDDDPVGIGTGGRQSYLVHPDPKPAPTLLNDYSGRLDLVRGYGSLNGIATADEVIRVGGYQSVTKRPARYSACGSLRPLGPDNAEATGPGIDVSAPSDRSKLRPGLWSIGTLSGARALLIGTSAACPLVTRRMVQNAVQDADIWTGFTPRPNIRPQEPGNDIAKAQHKARLGPRIAPAMETML